MYSFELRTEPFDSIAAYMAFERESQIFPSPGYDAARGRRANPLRSFWDVEIPFVCGDTASSMALIVFRYDCASLDSLGESAKKASNWPPRRLSPKLNVCPIKVTVSCVGSINGTSLPYGDFESFFWLTMLVSPPVDLGVGDFAAPPPLPGSLMRTQVLTPLSTQPLLMIL